MTQALKWAASIEEDPLGVGPGERFFCKLHAEKVKFGAHFCHNFGAYLHIFVTILHIFV